MPVSGVMRWSSRYAGKCTEMNMSWKPHTRVAEAQQHVAAVRERFVQRFADRLLVELLRLRFLVFDERRGERDDEQHRHREDEQRRRASRDA